jgi:hypothetical protein
MVDGLGRVHVTFSEQMNSNYSDTFLNGTYVKIYIKPFIGEFDLNSTSRNLYLTKWSVFNFKGNRLELQLEFENPMDVSRNFVYD